MGTIRISLLVFIGLVSSSCTMSVHSLFNDGDRSLEPALAGVWQDKEQKATLTLRLSTDRKVYSLHTEVKDQPAASGDFNAVLGTVGKHRFLEIIARNIGPKGFDLYSFWKVELDVDSLTLTPLNPHWIEAMDEEKMQVIEHEAAPGGIMLTASTEELKAFVVKYGDNKSAFSDPLKFQRKK